MYERDARRARAASEFRPTNISLTVTSSLAVVVTLGLALTLALALGAAAGDAAGAGANSKRTMNAELNIVSFGSINGELDDCGCKSQPKGGLPWRSAVMDGLRLYERPMLQLDMGNFASTEEEGAGEIKTRFLWEAMGRLGVDAITLGTRELALWPTMAELIAAGDIPVVCSNLWEMKDGARHPVGERSRIVDVNGIKVGLIGLIDGESVAKAHAAGNAADAPEFQFDDPLEAALALVPQLRAECDLVVLMSAMPANETDALIAQVPGVDIALYGNQPNWKQESAKHGGTIVQQTGTRGQYLGRLLLIVDPDGEIVDYGAVNRLVDNEFGIDEAMRAEIDEVTQRAKDRQAEARAKRPSAGESKIGG